LTQGRLTTMSRTSGSRWTGPKGAVEYDADGFPVMDPRGEVAPFPGESHGDACRRWAREDEFEEDPERAAREAHAIRALRDDELFAAELSAQSLTTLPQALRRLVRANPANAKMRALYDDVVRELYDRADDTLRASLPAAVERMLDIMESGEKDSDRLKAAIYVFERLRGKTPDVIEVHQDKPFQVVLQRLVAGPRMAAAARTALPGPDEPVDAEIVSETLSEPMPVAETLDRVRRQARSRAQDLAADAD
jgi:hypothetical protein